MEKTKEINQENVCGYCSNKIIGDECGTLILKDKDVHDSINKIKTIKSENQLFYRDFYGNTNVIINDDLKIIYNNELLNTSTLNELSKFNIKYFCSISTSYGETNPLVTKTYNAITRENVY